MCQLLQVSRANYYSYKEKENFKDEYTDLVIKIFEDNQSVYGTRKIKVELSKLGYQVSRRRIGRIMRLNGLVSAYTVKKYRVINSEVNNDEIGNLLNREFNERGDYEVLVSDLTYVRVKDKWNYICLILNLHNREIVGYSAGIHKDAKLVYQAIGKIKTNLNNVQIFHSDRGGEFKNYLIDDLLKVFNINRSLSNKGCPYDNAVAEATFKIVKTEFTRSRWFNSLEHLKFELDKYVEWFNHKRIHSSLGYLSPIQYKDSILNLSV